MVHSALLAVSLDEEMLSRNGVVVSDATVPDSDLPECSDLAEQLSGRFLIKYLRSDSLNRYSNASGLSHFPGKHFITPTVLCADTVVSSLNLPTYLVKPKFALVLDPSKLHAHGPRKVRGGNGAVEYLLMDGFAADAIVPPPWPREIK